MNLLTIQKVIQLENMLLKSQASLKKVKDDKEKDKLIVEIIKLNGQRNDWAAKIGRMK